MKIEQIAINSISTADGPLEEVCAAYAGAGFKNIEIPLARVKGWMKQGHSAGDATKLFKAHGLRFIGGFESHFAAFDAARMEQVNALNRANAELVGELGGGALVVGTDGPQPPGGEKNVDALKRLGEGLAGFAEKVPKNVAVALEFNWSPLVKSLKSAYLAVEAAGHERVGILFDPAHYYCTPTKLDDLDSGTVGKILHVHMNDMRDVPGDLAHCNDDRVLPGEGVIDLREIILRLEQHGYKGHYSIELFNKDIWKLPVGKAAGMCYEAMKGLAVKFE